MKCDKEKLKSIPTRERIGYKAKVATAFNDWQNDGMNVDGGSLMQYLTPYTDIEQEIRIVTILYSAPEHRSYVKRVIRGKICKATLSVLDGASVSYTELEELI